MLWDLAEFADNTAVIDNRGNTLTYAALKHETEALAQKIGRRCLVFSLCRNEIGSLIGYIAFLNGNIPPVMLNSSLDEALLADLLAAYSPAYIWCPEEQKEQFVGMEEVYAAYGYALLKTNFNKEYPLYDELGLLLTTSGSTGSPKFVRQSYANILDNARSSVPQYFSLTRALCRRNSGASSRKTAQPLSAECLTPTKCSISCAFTEWSCRLSEL